MLSEKYKTIMIHIDKCAGVSICNHFQAYGWRHQKWYIYKKYNSYKWENYFKFAFVRNPWDRVVSAYLYSIFYAESERYDKEKIISKDKYAFQKYAVRQEGYRQKFRDFNHFLRYKGYNTVLKIVGLETIHLSRRNTKFNHCYKYIYDDDMNCQVDFVGRYENLDKDMTYIQQKLGMPIEPIPHNNSLKSKRPHYSAFYNDESIEIVREIYKVDVELFDYEFERVVPYDHNLANTLDWVDKD